VRTVLSRRATDHGSGGRLAPLVKISGAGRGRLDSESDGGGPRPGVRSCSGSGFASGSTRLGSLGRPEFEVWARTVATLQFLEALKLKLVNVIKGRKGGRKKLQKSCRVTAELSVLDPLSRSEFAWAVFSA
jgi:hypothetical protein